MANTRQGSNEKLYFLRKRYHSRIIESNIQVHAILANYLSNVISNGVWLFLLMMLIALHKTDNVLYRLNRMSMRSFGTLASQVANKVWFATSQRRCLESHKFCNSLNIMRAGTVIWHQKFNATMFQSPNNVHG